MSIEKNSSFLRWVADQLPMLPHIQARLHELATWHEKHEAAEWARQKLVASAQAGDNIQRSK